MSETAVEQSADERVTIRHPETSGVYECTREQFDVVYAERGWELMSAADALVANVVPEADSIRSLTKAGLVDVAEANGIAVPDRATKDDLIAAIEAAAAASQEG